MVVLTSGNSLFNSALVLRCTGYPWRRLDRCSDFSSLNLNGVHRLAPAGKDTGFEATRLSVVKAASSRLIMIILSTCGTTLLITHECEPSSAFSVDWALKFQGEYNPTGPMAEIDWTFGCTQTTFWKNTFQLVNDLSVSYQLSHRCAQLLLLIMLSLSRLQDNWTADQVFRRGLQPSMLCRKLDLHFKGILNPTGLLAEHALNSAMDVPSEKLIFPSLPCEPFSSLCYCPVFESCGSVTAPLTPFVAWPDAAPLPCNSDVAFNYPHWPNGHRHAPTGVSPRWD